MRSERDHPQVPTDRDILQVYDRLIIDFQRDPTPRHLARVWAQEERISMELAKPGRFELGILLQTPGAQDAMITSFHIPAEFLLRHK